MPTRSIPNIAVELYFLFCWCSATDGELLEQWKTDTPGLEQYLSWWHDTPEHTQKKWLAVTRRAIAIATAQPDITILDREPELETWRKTHQKSRDSETTEKEQSSTMGNMARHAYEAWRDSLNEWGRWSNLTEYQKNQWQRAVTRVLAIDALGRYLDGWGESLEFREDEKGLHIVVAIKAEGATAKVHAPPGFTFEEVRVFEAITRVSFLANDGTQLMHVRAWSAEKTP